jgi:hypothetical protein
VAWFVNESGKRAWEEYQRKETNYRALLSASRGFFVNAQDTKRKADFLEQVELCWLYCSDEVIRRANEFLDSVKTGAHSPNPTRRFAQKTRHSAHGSYGGRLPILQRKLISSSAPLAKK